MNSNSTINTSNVGNAIWQQLQNAMPTTPVEEFAELHDLKDLAGNSTGSIEVLTAPNLVKMSLLSINMGPGRYFNIHVIPQANLQVPRFLFEGMVMPGGVTFNGRQILEDANEEIIKLEEEARLNWETPIDFLIG